MAGARAIERIGDAPCAPFRSARPAVIERALPRWPATLFHLRALAERFGDEEVLTYRLAPDGGRMSALKSDFYMWSDGDAGNRAHLTRWRFGEMLEALARGEPHYCMANRTKNARLRERLAAEAGPVAGVADAGAWGEFFIGSRGAGPGLHHDGPIESFLCQLVGTKRVNAFAPADAAFLYPAAPPGEPHAHFSAVADSFDADPGRFPLFARATVHRCELRPGEALYIPPHWYHDTDPEGPSVSMSVRRRPADG